MCVNMNICKDPVESRLTLMNDDNGAVPSTTNQSSIRNVSKILHRRWPVVLLRYTSELTRWLIPCLVSERGLLVLCGRRVVVSGASECV